MVTSVSPVGLPATSSDHRRPLPCPSSTDTRALLSDAARGQEPEQAARTSWAVSVPGPAQFQMRFISFSLFCHSFK
jgi:hypothetical protein